MKINKPFMYIGSKGHFYKEIKKIFENSGKEKYIDLFAGGLEVALNIKEDFPKTEVLANVKDEHIESLLKNKKTATKRYFELIKFLYKDIKLKSSRLSFLEKKEWGELKKRYKEFWEKNELNFTEQERNYVELLCSMNKGQSLSSNFYSENKVKKLDIYLEKIEKIGIKSENINKKWKFNDSFILLDPPYVTSTRVDKKAEKGYNYKGNWKEENDKELIEFIKNNLNRNNVFLVFGSVGNPLSNMIRKEFPKSSFIIKTYNRSMFGKASVREEWYCLIK